MAKTPRPYWNLYNIRDSRFANRECYNNRMFGGREIAVLLKVGALRGRPWTQLDVASDLALSPSTVSEALRKASEVGLYSPERKRVNPTSLEELALCGAKYFLTPRLGPLGRGMPTCWGMPALSHLVATGEEQFVWPDPEGNVRGTFLQPLWDKAPYAAKKDAELYELLALFDILRVGTSREREVAIQEFRRKIRDGASD